jgi:hypothetical protein
MEIEQWIQLGTLVDRYRVERHYDCNPMDDTTEGEEHPHQRPPSGLWIILLRGSVSPKNTFCVRQNLPNL